MINGKRYLTITVDASFHPNEPHAGLAAYIIWDTPSDRTERYEATCSVEAESSTQAEAYAVMYGLFTALQMGLVGVDKIIVNSDCEYVVHAASEFHKEFSDAGLRRDIQIGMYHFRRLFACPIEVRKVKAHTNPSKSSPREAINNRVDILAKHTRRITNASKPDNRTDVEGTDPGSAQRKRALVDGLNYRRAERAKLRRNDRADSQ